MLKELNSIANGLLGLHGYPVRPLGNPETSGKRARAVSPNGESIAHALRVDKPVVLHTLAPALRARSYFSW
jgi:hypothetical protein